MVDTNRLHEVSPQQLWQRLTQLRQRLLTGMEGGLSALSALDLTLPQAMALFRLVERGPLTVSELQKAVGRSQAATSHLVTQLQRRKLVLRKNDSNDGRRTLVQASSKALALVKQVEGLRIQGFQKVVATVPKTVLRQLDAALAATLAAMPEQP